MEKTLLFACADDLLNTIATASTNFKAISETEWSKKEREGKWNRKEVLGHLIDSAANNHLRFVRAQLVEKEYISFSYEQEFFVNSQHYAERHTADLIDLWVSYNKHLAAVIRNVDPTKLTISCIIGNNAPVPLSFIISDYMAHLKHHLGQIIS
jgi:hypothetical protein